MAFRKFKESLQFRNGNLNLKISKEDMVDFKKDQILFLLELLDRFDCSFIGETFCLNNFETGHIIYNSYMDCWYVISWADVDDLDAGRTLKLNAREMTGEIRELIKMEGVN